MIFFGSNAKLKKNLILTWMFKRTFTRFTNHELYQPSIKMSLSKKDQLKHQKGHRNRIKLPKNRKLATIRLKNGNKVPDGHQPLMRTRAHFLSPISQNFISKKKRESKTKKQKSKSKSEPLSNDVLEAIQDYVNGLFTEFQ